ncbi:MarR family transcriptional regulator [Jeotgalibacillus sp. S-D1]|uniref:MarR family winged helix-turn-helix transcriptional regulator n=1 Tax=Jeotgalibacillus sp. S-D1 TaxID=2552189 RepID=UPI0010592A1D|nr:MarR family transcriptional regulator [Jeotgalibacillus sp. S-D1]TDL31274.1 MarR family transcriptional regulator [Jeotgalibacillus sp. S-D1]
MRLAEQCAGKESVLLRLHDINKRVAPKFESCMGISQTRLAILQRLFEVDEISQKDLQLSVKVDHAAVTRHLKQMEEHGTISRHKNAADNRVTYVRLTDEGRSRIAHYCAEKTHFIEQLFDGFSEEESNQLNLLLERVQYNIEFIQKREMK